MYLTHIFFKGKFGTAGWRTPRKDSCKLFFFLLAIVFFFCSICLSKFEDTVCCFYFYKLLAIFAPQLIPFACVAEVWGWICGDQFWRLRSPWRSQPGWTGIWRYRHREVTTKVTWGPGSNSPKSSAETSITDHLCPHDCCTSWSISVLFQPL